MLGCAPAVKSDLSARSSPCAPKVEHRTIAPLPVRLSPLSRVMAWFCLALLLVTGLTPARDYVLCIEPDGCVNLEAKAPADRCGACDDHHDRDAVEVAATNDDGAGCACIDLAVPSGSELVTAKLRSIASCSGPWILPSASIGVAPAELRDAGRTEQPPDVPRVAQSLTHIRSVVLLV